MITDCYEHEYNDLCVFRLPTQFRYILKPYQKKKLYIYIYIYIYMCVCVCVCIRPYSKNLYINIMPDIKLA